jgi:hypothetical protein
LANGQVGKEKSDEMHDPRALSHVEMANRLKGSLAKSTFKARSKLTLFNGGCASGDSTAKLLNDMTFLGASRMVTANHNSLLGWSGVYSALGDVLRYKSDFIFSAIYNANELLHENYVADFLRKGLKRKDGDYYGEHLGIFLGLTPGQARERNAIMGQPVKGNQPKGVIELDPGIPVTEAIGNKAQGTVQEEGGNLFLDVTDRENDRHDDLGSVPLHERTGTKDSKDIRALLQADTKLNEYSALGELLQKIAKVQDAPRRYVYSNHDQDGKVIKIKDLFGISPKDRKLVGLYEGLLAAEIPPSVRGLAWLHEFMHNAVNRKLLDFGVDIDEATGKITLKVYPGPKEKFKEAATIELTDDLAKELAQTEPASKFYEHNLLRAFQREVFGVIDVALSDLIKTLQTNGDQAGETAATGGMLQPPDIPRPPNGGLDLTAKNFKIKTNGNTDLSLRAKRKQSQSEITAVGDSLPRNDGVENYDYLTFDVTALESVTKTQVWKMLAAGERSEQ